jgi:hypothetical protein
MLSPNTESTELDYKIKKYTLMLKNTNNEKDKELCQQKLQHYHRMKQYGNDYKKKFDHILNN